MSAIEKPEEWPTRVVFRIIKSGKGPTDVKDIATAIGMGVTAVNRKLIELIQRGLVTRSIDPDNPRKRQMIGQVQLTKLGRKTAPESVLPTPKPLTPLMVDYWRYLRRFQVASINGCLSLISKPEDHRFFAARKLQPWVIWLAKAGYIAVQVGSEEVKLWDRMYYLAKDNGPEAPDWIEE